MAGRLHNTPGLPLGNGKLNKGDVRVPPAQNTAALADLCRIRERRRRLSTFILPRPPFRKIPGPFTILGYCKERSAISPEPALA